MGRVYNFSAGPSMLPESVLKRAAQEMLDYKGSGQSVMEMSHRSHWFEEIIQEAEALPPGRRFATVLHGSSESTP